MEEAKKQLKKAQEYQKRYFEVHHRQLGFGVGQKVLLSAKNPKLRGIRKLYPRWFGPFKVLQRVEAAACKLDLARRFS